MPEKIVMHPRDWPDHTLLDSGSGRKLERFGTQTLDRPEPRAVWKPALPEHRWQTASASYAEQGGWQVLPDASLAWQIRWDTLTLNCELADSRQVGVFAESAAQWGWLKAQVAARNPKRVLNLFGYSGVASLVCTAGGAEVVHVDAARRAIGLGMANQKDSGLGGQVVRWLVDDVNKFVARELRRGNKYDALILDPPKYGLGPKKERWQFEKGYAALCEDCRGLLSETPAFVLVTAYALESPPEVLRPGIERIVGTRGGELKLGELVTVEESAGRQISHSITARWTSA